MRAKVLESVATAARGRKQSRTGRVKLVLLMGLWLICLAPHPVHAQAEWDVQTLEYFDNALGTTERSLRFDSDGFPHIVYGFSDKGLEHAWHDGAGWRYETVDDSPEVGAYSPSLVIDESDNPHISYLCDGLKYAHWNGIEWHIETVDSVAPQIYGPTSLALDGNGYPHISYREEQDEVLKYAYLDGSGWHKEIVDDVATLGIHSPLALDVDGVPHICYFGNDTLKYVSRDGYGWHRESVATTFVDDAIYQGVSMVLDETSFPHISYVSAEYFDSPFMLWYAHKDESGWQIAPVEEVFLYTVPSIALDGSGNPHISYGTLRPPEFPYVPVLRHAFWNGMDWEMETVVSGYGLDSVARDRFVFISLSLDGSGSPCISFVRYLIIDDDYVYSLTLNYAQREGDSWNVERVDGNGGAGFPNAIALDQSGHPHIGYRGHSKGDICEATFGSLLYTYWDGSEWLRETVDVGPDNGEYLSLALDSEGYPHFSYYDDWAGLKYAYKDEPGWNLETIEGGWETGRGTSLALDGNDVPHVSYYDPNYVMKYAYKNGSQWLFETVDAATSVYHTCISLDGNGYPHICYSTGGLAKYAYKDAQGWHLQTVDSGLIGYVSLALDEDYSPHISYSVGNEVRLAQWTGADWGIETVGNGTPEGHRFLALDSSGFAHISINQKYVYWDGSDWQTETVIGDVNSFSSLALDGTDAPHISFGKNSAHLDSDLRYAHRLPGSINLSIAQDNGQFILSWAGYPAANAYWVYGAANLPYFVPGIGPGPEHRLDIVPPSATTWQTTNGLLDPENNWTYLVLAVDETEQELARSNRAGEHDFRVDIP